MAHVYVYDWDNDDYSTIGECGALDALSCTFEEVGGGMSEIALIHAVDALGKFRYLRPGAILKVNVPVRTTPEIENGQFVTRVENWTVKENTTKKQRYVYSRKTGGHRTKTLKAGTEVIVTQKPEDSERWKIKSGKVSGWMASDALENSVEITLPDNAAGIEDAAPSWESREQLFRIYKVNKTDDSISCNARHIQYDLLQNLTRFNRDDAVTLQESGDAILENCIDTHDFRFYTDISGTQPGAHYTDTDPVTALLDPDSGLLEKWNAQLVRDNFEIYMLGNAGLDRGLRIEYGKNMLGVEMDEDTENTATAILPMGEKKNGDALYMAGDGLVLSPYADQYPFKRIYPFKCSDCTIGTNGVTEKIALARMQEQAEELFAQGVDLPTISVKVTFANLGRSERYAQYRNLENVYLYDSVTVRNSRLGIDEKTQVVRVVWDCLNEKMQTIELGSLQALSQSVASWQISGGISGSKLINGSIGAAQISGDSISPRHLQVGSVNAEAVQAESITAEKLAAGSVTAEKLAAGAITADKIQAGSITTEKLAAGAVDAGKIQANSITGDKIAAGTITAGNIASKTITADRLKAQLITAGCGLIATGAIQTAQIADGSITAAKIVSLNADVITAGTIQADRLLIAGDDGLIYKINATSSGLTKSQLTEAQYKKQINGTVIVANSITAAQIAAETITGNEIAANAIKAANIDVSSLFASEAFITQLQTSKIIGGQSLEIIVRNAESSSRNFYQEKAPTSADYVRPGDTWTIPSTGEVWQAKDMDYIGLKFYIDDNLNLGYTLDEDDGSIKLEVQEDGCLYAEGIRLSVLEDGTMGTPYIWERVQDSELKGLANSAQNSANAAQSSANAAQSTANSAQTAANSAQNSANAAQSSANAAQSTANSAQTAASNAQSAADAAQSSADAAQSTADEAQATADSAVNGASEAMNRANAALSQADFERVVRIDTEGLHVGDNKTDVEVLIDSASMNVVIEGTKVSTYSDKFIRLDNMQVRKVRGGLAISVYKGSV